MSNEVVAVDDGMSAVAVLGDDAVMNRVMKFAEVMATGKATIPKELQNVGDCMALTLQAMNWKMNPFSVAQKVHFINGKIGYEAQLVAAAVENSGAVIGGFHFEWYGPWEKVVGKFEIKINSDKKEYRVPGWQLKDEEGIGIRVWATKRGESEPRVLDLLLAQARTRNSTLWADDPKQQLAYLAQKRWARLYTPGVILGVYTPDELEPQPQEKDITAQAEVVISPYPTDKFETNKVSWKKTVDEKKKTAEALIATINSRAATENQALTEEQMKEIRSWETPQQEPQQQVQQETKDPFVAAMEQAEGAQQ